MQALLCGSAVLALLPDSIGGSSQALSFAVPMLIITLGLHLLMLLGEVAMPHTTDNARYGARLMTHGPFANAFWGGAVVVGGVVPMVLLFGVLCSARPSVLQPERRAYWLWLDS